MIPVDRPTLYVVVVDEPDPDAGVMVTGYWLGPHAGDDLMADWSAEIPRFGSLAIADNLAGYHLVDRPGTSWRVIPEREACVLARERT